jgi:hypothetical protein
VPRTFHLLLLALPALASSACAAELSGTIHSATGKLPADVKVLAESLGKSPAIAGSVENGRYRIDLPEGRRYALRVRAPGWDAAPKYIPGPITGGARDILLYPAPVPEPALAQELIGMGETDQAIRKQIPAGSDPEFWKRMAAEDKVREERLARIIDEKGWPLMSQVGHKAANSAWLIAQHGSHDFLKRCLPLMQAAAGKHEMPLSSLALSADRVLVQDGKEQLYGSQFQANKEGKTVPYPIADTAHLDERRASMGLEPFEQYRKHFE